MPAVEATKKQKVKGKAWWWQCNSVVLVAIFASQVLCKLQCKLCKVLLSPSNPPDVCKSHLRSGPNSMPKLGDILPETSILLLSRGHMPNFCTSRSPLINAIFGRGPAQAQTAAASV
eukprot:1140354-Pelagomonas_calceolata.AAC.4